MTLLQLISAWAIGKIYYLTKKYTEMFKANMSKIKLHIYNYLAGEHPFILHLVQHFTNLFSSGPNKISPLSSQRDEPGIR